MTQKADKAIKTPSHIVCVGASAGGLEAIELLFSNMPHKSGLAFVVIQHLSPDYKSLMVELLSKKTKMDVLRAEEGLFVEANKVYLIPPKKNLKIFHGKLQLVEQVLTKGINLPIDIFMKSLAEDAGEKSIGIILSGTGSDGTRGLRAIKEVGGMIMVQQYETAKFDGMPRSAISTGLADYILPPEEMPEFLTAYTQHLQLAKSSNINELVTDEDNLNHLFGMIRDKHKLDFTYYKKTTILRRLERRMTITHQENLESYLKYIETNQREITSLYQEFLIGVTSFFRDDEAFQLLRDTWLPEILRANPSQEIRFWVVGCSTGEEAYSIAILAKELMSNMKIKKDLKIFATDIDSQAILKAGNGIYPFSIAADVNPQLLSKYFVPCGDNFQISREIREMVVFARHNIIKDPPFTNIEFLSCRNLLIYLQPVMQQKVMEMFNFSLNKGSILFLGSSETTGDLLDYFEPLNNKWKIFRSRGKKKIVQENMNFRSSYFQGAYDRHTRTDGAKYHFFNTEIKLFERILESMYEDYLPVTLVVNEVNEIVRVIGDASPYIKIPVGRMLNDVTKMAIEELLIPIATGLQKVFKYGKSVNYSNIRLHNNDQISKVNLRIRLVQEKKGQLHYALVFIEKQKTSMESHNKELEYDLDKDAKQRIADLEQELQYTRENLQATIEELETSNEELQATNEELLASNEELQSTNEELQSVNEELHTVNAEHQSKIMELAELNSDMDNLLNIIEMGTLFLDENLTIRKFSPLIEKIFRLGAHNIGDNIVTIDHNLQRFNLLENIKSAIDNKSPIFTQVENTKGEWYLLKLLPYELAPGIYSGILITILNIDPLKETEANLFKREEWLNIAALLMRAGYWEIDKKTGKTLWSDGIYEIHEVDKSYDHDVENGIDFYHPEDQPKISEAVQLALEKGIPFDLELRFITAKGKKLWVRSIGQAEKIDNKIIRVYGAFQDITHLKKLEIKLAEKE